MAGSTLVGLCLAYAACAVPSHRSWAILTYVALFVPASMLVAMAWKRDDRRTVVAIVIVAIGARLAMSAAQPLWSNDAYRYVWDGRLANRGIDPRSITPNDPMLQGERGSALWPHIDLRSISTVYPPLGISVFRLAAFIDSNGVVGAKVISLAGDVATIAIIMIVLRQRRLPRGRVTLYALHPLVLISFAQDAHLESMAVAGVCLAMTRSRLVRASGLAVAILTKIYPIIFAPVLFLRDITGAVWTALIVLLAYLPALFRGHALGSLGAFVGTQRFNESVFALAGPFGSAALLAASVLCAAVAVGRGAEPAGVALAVAAAYLLTTPNALPWYVTILPALIIFVPQPFGN